MDGTELVRGTAPTRRLLTRSHAVSDMGKMGMPDLISYGFALPAQRPVTDFLVAPTQPGGDMGLHGTHHNKFKDGCFCVGAGLGTRDSVDVGLSRLRGVAMNMKPQLLGTATQKIRD